MLSCCFSSNIHSVPLPRHYFSYHVQEDEQEDPFPVPLPPQLKQLDLRLYQEFDLPHQALEGLTCLEKLKLGHLQDKLFSDDSALLHLPSSLTFLQLSVDQVSKELTISPNHHLFQLSKLKELRLGIECEMNDQTLWFPAALSSLTSLETFGIEVFISDEHRDHYSMMCHLPDLSPLINLRQLGLRHNRKGEVEFKMVRSPPPCEVEYSFLEAKFPAYLQIPKDHNSS